MSRTYIPSTTARGAHRRSGVSERKARRGEKDRGAYCSFEDVRRKCHQWLMKRDPVYRQQVEAREEGRPSNPHVGF